MPPLLCVKSKSIAMIQIAGIGTVFCGGRGVAALESVLKNSTRTTVFADCPGVEHQIPLQPVASKLLKDKAVLKGMRRADRLSKMAVLAAWDAWNDTNLENIRPERIGVIAATGLGPHVRTFKFLDGILDYGDAAVSPTDFSHSVHSTAAGYITKRLQTHGVVQSVTDFDFAFQQALRLAECWLSEQRCDAVLLGTAEELGDVMLHVCSRLCCLPDDGIPQPYAFSDTPCLVPGEGAVYFVLTREPAGACYAGIENVTDGNAAGMDNVNDLADLTIFDAEGLSGDETVYASRLPGITQLANYTPLFGSMMTGTAFQCAAAAVAIRNQTRYASPLADTAAELPLSRTTESVALKRIVCEKHSGRTGCSSSVCLSAADRVEGKRIF